MTTGAEPSSNSRPRETRGALSSVSVPVPSPRSLKRAAFLPSPSPRSSAALCIWETPQDRPQQQQRCHRGTCSSGERLWWLFLGGCVRQQRFENQNSCRGKRGGVCRYALRVKSYSLYTSLVKKGSSCPRGVSEQTRENRRTQQAGRLVGTLGGCNLSESAAGEAGEPSASCSPALWVPGEARCGRQYWHCPSKRKGWAPAPQTSPSARRAGAAAARGGGGERRGTTTTTTQPKPRAPGRGVRAKSTEPVGADGARNSHLS